MSGGGGSSGSVEFPDYMEKVHKNWLGLNPNDDFKIAALLPPDLTLGAKLRESLFNNPFEDAGLPSAVGYLGDMSSGLSRFEGELDVVDAKTQWNEVLEKASSNLESVLPTTDVKSLIEDSRVSAKLSFEEAVSSINELIDSDPLEKSRKSFERRADWTRTRAFNRFSGGMLDINAVHSSAFILGAAIIEAQHMQSVNDFDTEMSKGLLELGLSTQTQILLTEVQSRVNSKLQDNRNFVLGLDRAVTQMVQIFLQKLGYEEAYMKTTIEKARIATVINLETATADIDLDARYANWDFNIYNKAANVLASISGASAVLPDAPSRTQSAIGGALGGASTGSSLGVPGALAGGVLGGIGGYLSA